MAGKGNVRALVLREITKSPGVVVYLNDIMNHTGLTATQVKQSIYNMKALGVGDEIEIVIPANAWRYHPNASNGQEPELLAEPDDIRVVSRSTLPDVEIITPGNQLPEIPLKSIKRDKKLYEEVGTTKQFGTLVQDEDGELYRIEPL